MSDKRVFNMESAFDMLYLSLCAVKGEAPRPENLRNRNLAELLAICQFHNLTSLVYDSVRRLPSDVGEENKEALESFFTENQKSVRKTMLFDAERKRIFDFFEEKGIWYMPLKGIVTKELYPQLGLRQMTDNDILFDADYRENVRDWFAVQGYTVEAYGIYNHDIYTKPPVFNYEMHIELYSKSQSEVFNEYYADVKSRLLKDNDNSFGYHFSDEDFYIHSITHSFKHYDGGGAGLRFLIDQYVYLLKKPSLDFQYISQELKKLGIFEFEKECRSLILKIAENIHSFNSDILNQREMEMLCSFLAFGAFGTVFNRIGKKVRKEGKAAYIFRRIFPSAATFQEVFPKLGRYKILLPFWWLWRIFGKMFIKRKKVAYEIKAVLKTKNK